MNAAVRLLPIATVLAACGSAKPMPDPRIEVLEQRLAEQVRRIDSLEAARKRALLDGPPAPSEFQPQPTSYLLIGGGTLGDDGKRYASQSDCEAAKKSVTENADQLAKQARDRGAAFIPPAAMSCLPALPEQTNATQ